MDPSNELKSVSEIGDHLILNYEKKIVIVNSKLEKVHEGENSLNSIITFVDHRVVITKNPAESKSLSSE